jgi:hypothetical protein
MQYWHCGIIWCFSFVLLCFHMVLFSHFGTMPLLWHCTASMLCTALQVLCCAKHSAVVFEMCYGCWYVLLEYLICSCGWVSDYLLLTLSLSFPKIDHMEKFQAHFDNEWFWERWSSSWQENSEPLPKSPIRLHATEYYHSTFWKSFFFKMDTQNASVQPALSLASFEPELADAKKL